MAEHKLTIEQVSEIRRQYRYGRRTARIAKEFNVSAHTIWKIVRERIYKRIG